MNLYEIYHIKANELEYIQNKVNKLEGSIFEANLTIRNSNLELEALTPLLIKKREEMELARQNWDNNHGK
jgi:hypothetical protein